jgi:hypothetical protein
MEMTASDMKPAKPGEARRAAAASLRWIAELLLDGSDDMAMLDKLTAASEQLVEAERVIEMCKRIIEERQQASPRNRRR